MACLDFKNQYKVSIVTVCLNSAQTIERTIQSVLCQSYANIEYIIVDGGSRDGTLDIIRRYEERIYRWISEGDYGIYDAMNKGIRMANGDVIGIINSNDWYEHDAVHSVMEQFQNDKDLDIVYGDVIIIGDREKRKECLGAHPAIPNIHWYWQPSVFIKKAVYEKYGLFDVNYFFASDMAYFLRLQIQNVHARYVPKLISNFSWGGISNNKQYLWKKSRELIRIFDDILKKMPLTKEQENKFYHAKERAILVHKGLASGYLMRRLSKAGKQQDFWRSMLVRFNKKMCVVWGTGNDGEDVWHDNPALMPLARRYVDHNPVKCNYRFHGLPVSLPQTTIRQDDLVIVASSRYAEEIADELNYAGYKKGRDYVVYGDSSFYMPAIEFYVCYLCSCSKIAE